MLEKIEKFDPFTGKKITIEHFENDPPSIFYAKNPLTNEYFPIEISDNKLTIDVKYFMNLPLMTRKEAKEFLNVSNGRISQILKEQADKGEIAIYFDCDGNPLFSHYDLVKYRAKGK